MKRTFKDKRAKALANAYTHLPCCERQAYLVERN